MGKLACQLRRQAETTLLQRLRVANTTALCMESHANTVSVKINPLEVWLKYRIYFTDIGNNAKLHAN